MGVNIASYLYTHNPDQRDGREAMGNINLWPFLIPLFPPFIKGRLGRIIRK